MTDFDFLMIIVGMGLVTYLPRWAPLFFLSRRSLPQWFIRWLDLIPAAILSALLMPALLTNGEPRHLDFLKPELLAAVPTLLFALKTKSLGGTVIVGILVFWLLARI
jgi:branched-subunit amino acid transport protein